MVVLPPTGEPPIFNTNYVYYWNNVALDLNRLTVTLKGPQNDPPGSSRTLGIMHLAINDAYFAINPNPVLQATTYLTPDAADPSLRLPALNGASDARQAVAGAAKTVLNQLYSATTPRIATATTTQLLQFLDQAVAILPDINEESSSFLFGAAVANTLLELLDNEAVFAQGVYVPPIGRYFFDDDPTNPLRIVPVNPNDPAGPTEAIVVYDAPYYGKLAKRLAVQREHLISDPPVNFSRDNQEEYRFAVDDVYREGGQIPLNSTKRTPDQTVTGYYWAYDGSNLIGTPPRHYNQILRLIAWERMPAGPTDEATIADFVRIFALANVAMSDAGLEAWTQKYTYQFWRPLSGIREDNQNPQQDAFWRTLSAPETNSNLPSFKPPFPSYPSGHATFGGAFFQMLRQYYKKRDNLDFSLDGPDDIGFTMISDELNGVNRDLAQPYDPTLPIDQQEGVIRTRAPKTFHSLWDAMLDNGLSRIFLGVHWNFDSAAPDDILVSKKLNQNGTTQYKKAVDVRYEKRERRFDRPAHQLFPVGGIPLGIGIANDIFKSNLKPTPDHVQPVVGVAAADVTEHAINGSTSQHATKFQTAI